LNDCAEAGPADEFRLQFPQFEMRAPEIDGPTVYFSFFFSSHFRDAIHTSDNSLHSA
jgi:hypothetical protein